MTGDFIISGPQHDYVFKNETAGDYIINRLRKAQTDAPANIDAVTGKVQTAENILNDTIKAVALFKKMKLGKGDVISIISQNVLNYNVPLLAAWCLGITVNPLNPDLTADEYRRALRLCKPKMTLCSSRSFGCIREIQKEFDGLRDVVLFGDDTDNLGVKTFDDMLLDMVGDQRSFKPDQFDPDATGCVILMSSGTTGFPKGVFLTHRNLRCFLSICTDPRYWGCTSKDTFLLVLPICHIFGLLVYCGSMIAHSKNVMLPKFAPELFLSAIQEHKVTQLHVVPTLALFMCKSPLVEKYDLASVESILCGGACAGKELIEEFKKRFSKIVFRQAYGATEMAGTCTFTPGNICKDTSVGKLIPGLKAKVCELKGSKNLGPMQAGELRFKGPVIMNGYIDGNGSEFDQEGFYCSGDVGYYNEEGFFYVVGRIKEIIKFKGFQVSPAELETILSTHPAVRECCVVGKPDERAGHVPIAFVVLQPGASVSEKELIDLVAEKLSSTKWLYGGVRFVEALPKTVSGKVIRHKVEKMLLNTLPAAPYF